MAIDRDVERVMGTLRNCSTIVVPPVLNNVKIAEDYLEELETEYNNVIANRHSDTSEFEIEERVGRCRYLMAQQSAVRELIRRLLEVDVSDHAADPADEDGEF